MSLFVCDECGVVENTAFCLYWGRNLNGRDGRALCSQCDPEIQEWHGHFDRTQWDGERSVINRGDGW